MMLKIFGFAAVIVVALATAGQTASAAPAGRSGKVASARSFAGFAAAHRRRELHRQAFFTGWPYGWGPGYEEPADVYPLEELADSAPPPPAASGPPVCPELWHWDDKLGHATREKLCDASVTP